LVLKQRKLGIFGLFSTSFAIPARDSFIFLEVATLFNCRKAAPVKYADQDHWLMQIISFGIWDKSFIYYFP
jgi:hypothetical protein